MLIPAKRLPPSLRSATMAFDTFAVLSSNRLASPFSKSPDTSMKVNSPSGWMASSAAGHGSQLPSTITTAVEIKRAPARLAIDLPSPAQSSDFRLLRILNYDRQHKLTRGQVSKSGNARRYADWSANKFRRDVCMNVYDSSVAPTQRHPKRKSVKWQGLKARSKARVPLKLVSKSVPFSFFSVQLCANPLLRPPLQCRTSVHRGPCPCRSLSSSTDRASERCVLPYGLRFP